MPTSIVDEDDVDEDDDVPYDPFDEKDNAITTTLAPTPCTITPSSSLNSVVSLLVVIFKLSFCS